MQNNFTFGETLKELRAMRQISQVDLAQAIGVSKGIVSLWENGLREPTLTNLILLANFFNVSIDYLAGLSDK